MNIIKQSTTKRGRGRLQDEVVYEGFQLYSCVCENFGVSDGWSIIGGGRNWRFDCI